MESFLLKALPFGEFTATVVMCGFIIALYYKFSGQFDVQDIKIEHTERIATEANEKSKYALKASKKALKTSAQSLKHTKNIESQVGKIHKVVNGMQSDYTKYIEDKHAKTLTKQED